MNKKQKPMSRKKKNMVLTAAEALTEINLVRAAVKCLGYKEMKSYNGESNLYWFKKGSVEILINLED